MEGDLRAFSHRAQEEKEADDRQPRRETAGIGRRAREDISEVERSEEREDAEHTEKETEVADAVHDERLPARSRSVFPLVVVPDQEIRAEADAFPPHEHQDEVVRENERQHREHEQVHVGEVARVTRVGLVVLHVADRVEVDQETDERHEGNHQRREWIQAERHVHGEVACRDPWSDPLDDGAASIPEIGE